MSQPPNSVTNKLGRRTFLVTTCATVAVGCIAGSLVQGCNAGGGSGAGGPAGVQTTGLTVADLQVGSFHSGSGYILARDQGGFYAYSSSCTHNGCTLPAPDASGQSTCPCHHARFDATGANVAGPNGAGTLPDLEHYRVTFVGAGDTAQIQVDTSVSEPDPRTRATPPSAVVPDDAGAADAGASAV